MVKISIVSLIYQSGKYADWVHDSIIEYTPMIKNGDAEFFFIANDPTDRLIEHLDKKGYKYFLNINPKYSEEELFRMGYGKPEYINRVYKGWNRAILESQGEIVVLVNSDNYFSPDWLENLLKNLNKKRVVCSQLVERKHPKYGVFPGAIHGEFGNQPENFNKKGFMEFAKKIRKSGLSKEDCAYPVVIFPVFPKV